jgi:hypothetical protein
MLDKETFDRELNVILEDMQATDIADAFAEVIAALQEYDSAQEVLDTSQRTYNGHVNQLNSSLAGEIRKNQPGLTVKLGRDGSVTVSYHRSGSKQMCLTPNVRNQSWGVGQSAFERNYAKYCGESLNVDLPSMGKSIADYFTRSYKSLGEGTVEEGKLIIEEVVDTNTIAGAGVVNRLRAAYGELKVAFEFAKRAGLSQELIDELDGIGGQLIALAGNIAEEPEECEEDIDYDTTGIAGPM